MRAHVLLRRVEYCLWIAGALAVGFCAGVFIEGHIYQVLENRRLEEALKSERPPMPVPRGKTRPVGSLVGRLEIPRLKFSAIVLEGSDNGTLRLGVGRIPETAETGQHGNIVLSGHRDTFFRPLRGIKDGDRISLVTPEGKFHYVVDWTTVVNPTDTRSLMPTPSAALTLVTCYPFHYVGPAPERFIVRARQVESASVKVASYEEVGPHVSETGNSSNNSSAGRLQPATRRHTDQRRKPTVGHATGRSTSRKRNSA
jgi:sortase A